MKEKSKGKRFKKANLIEKEKRYKIERKNTKIKLKKKK